MTPEQRQLVEKIYPEVLALPESEQVAFLSERCGDQRVRLEIERLLDSRKEVSSELAPTTPLGSEEIKRRASDPLRSETTVTSHLEIPDYELVRCIGQGAFGSVWLARSATGVCCALKVIPKDRTNDVIYFDPQQSHTLGINILESVTEEQKPLVVSSLISIFKHIWGDSHWGARTEFIIENATYALLSQPDPQTLVGLQRFFTDTKFRKRIADNATNPLLFFGSQHSAGGSDHAHEGGRGPPTGGPRVPLCAALCSPLHGRSCKYASLLTP